MANTIVIPIVEETTKVVGVEVRDRERVRVTTHVDTEEVTLDAPFAREEIHVERVAIGREVDSPPPIRTEGDTTIIPVMEELVVVQKRLLVREELRITKRRVAGTRPVKVPRRRERAEVQRTDSRREPLARPGRKSP